MLLLPASAEAGFKRLGTGSVWADGNRWAVVRLDGQPVRVIDERTRRSWELPGLPDCDVAGAAAGQVLWGCGYPATPRLQNVESGAVSDVPGWDAYLSWIQTTTVGWNAPSGPDLVGFGSRWLRGVISCYHCGGVDSFIDWHNGRFVEGVDQTAAEVLDLDDPDIAARLCAPLRRQPDGDGGFIEPMYERPWLLENPYATRRHETLRHCGKRKPLRVARCGRVCISDLGGGYLTWSEVSLSGTTMVRAFRLSDRRKLRVGRAPGIGAVKRTRRTVYLTTYSGKVYAAPIPGR